MLHNSEVLTESVQPLRAPSRLEDVNIQCIVIIHQFI